MASSATAGDAINVVTVSREDPVDGHWEMTLRFTTPREGYAFSQPEPPNRFEENEFLGGVLRMSVGGNMRNFRVVSNENPTTNDGVTRINVVVERMPGGHDA